MSTTVAAGLIAAGVATPFLAVSRDALRANLDRWFRHLPRVVPHYAVKANTDPLVLRELFARGANADVASAFEIETCAALGLGGERMVLSNPRKDRDTILAMRRHRPWATVVDSEEEIDKLVQDGVPGDGYEPVLFARIKVPTRGVKQDLSSKFGIRVLDGGERPRLRLDALRAVLRHARTAGFSRFGLAFHVGTQCAAADVYRGALGLCRLAARGLGDDGLAIEWIDLGGGFADGRVCPDPDTLLAGVGAAAAELEGEGLRLIAEPGRNLVADAGLLVTRVIYDRSTDLTGRRVQIDDGVYRSLSGRVHDGREFQFRPLRADPAKPPFLGVVANCAIWGCSCDSFDKVSDGQMLPADLQVGDYLLAECVGAYSTSFGSNTNGFPPAPVVLYVEDGGRLTWEVSPLKDHNALLLAHVHAWASRNPGR